MTIDISDNNPRIDYAVAEGVVQTVFAVPFEFFEDSDVFIYVDGVLKTFGSDYTLSGGDGSTGTATFATAIPPAVQQVTGATGGSTVSIVRHVSLERTTDFMAGQEINRASLNEQLDVITAQIADLDDRVDRTVHLNDYEVSAPLELPSIDDRKGRVLSFDPTTGGLIQGPLSNDVQTIADNITGILDANNQATAAAASATAAAGSASSTAADLVQTNQDTIATAADRVQTGLDAAATAADLVQTNLDRIATAADRVQTGLDAAATADNLALTNADVVSTSADVVSTNASATAAAASESAVDADRIAAQTAASSASTSETNAAASEAAAAASQSATATSAASATTSETNASNSASAAATSESNASTSATSAATSATSASVSADAALAALDSFDDRYLGQKASDPTLDNDGNTLIAGSLYFNTTDSVMKVYEGSIWVAAYASLSGALLQVNNLSDVANIAASRTNLGLATVAATGSYADLSGAPVLGTAATTAATDYATASQGSTADTALQSGDNISELTNDAGYTTNTGDITGVTAGTGLSGGGASGAVTLNIDSTVATLTGSQNLTNKTLTSPAFTGSITEETGAMPAGTTPAIDPANGTVQEWTLTGNSSPTDSLADGEFVELMIQDGTAYTITWPTITWLTDSATAPTLGATTVTPVLIQKVGSTLYGRRTGDGG